MPPLRGKLWLREEYKTSNWIDTKEGRRPNFADKEILPNPSVEPALPLGEKRHMPVRTGVKRSRHVSWIHASCIHASCIHASWIQAPWIHVSWVHISWIHASWTHASWTHLRRSHCLSARRARRTKSRRPEGPQTRSWGPEGPLNFKYIILYKSSTTIWIGIGHCR